MRHGLDHRAREDLRIVERFGDRTHGAARHAGRAQFLDESDRARAARWPRQRSARSSSYARTRPALVAKRASAASPVRPSVAAERLPLRVVADGQHQHAVSGIERVVRRDRRVTVAGARRRSPVARARAAPDNVSSAATVSSRLTSTSCPRPVRAARDQREQQSLEREHPGGNVARSPRRAARPGRRPSRSRSSARPRPARRRRSRLRRGAVRSGRSRRSRRRSSRGCRAPTRRVSRDRAIERAGPEVLDQTSARATSDVDRSRGPRRS